MAKITRYDLIGPTGLGFVQAMFSVIAPDDLSFEQFVDAVIAEQALILEGRVGGAAYTATTGPTKDYVKLAEKFLAAAELVQRRINIILGNAQGAGQELDTSNERKQRSDYLSQAEIWITKAAQGVTADPSADIAVATVLTSRFE
jgi:hypothetical protein